MGRILHESLLLDKQWRGTLKNKQTKKIGVYKTKAFVLWYYLLQWPH